MFPAAARNIPPRPALMSGLEQHQERSVGQADYRIVRHGDGWAIDHDGKVTGSYATKEAAFESAVGAASNSIKEGLGVHIEVPQRAAGEAAIGSAAR